jgi:hypothetical protein
VEKKQIKKETHKNMVDQQQQLRFERERERFWCSEIWDAGPEQVEKEDSCVFFAPHNRGRYTGAHSQ